MSIPTPTAWQCGKASPYRRDASQFEAVPPLVAGRGAASVGIAFPGKAEPYRTYEAAEPPTHFRYRLKETSVPDLKHEEVSSLI